MTDDITKRLEALELARKNMQAQLEATTVALDAIMDKIDDLKSRQVARMRSDDRIDTRVVDKVQSGSSDYKQQAEAVKEERGTGGSEKKLKLVPAELSDADVTVNATEREA